MIFELVREFGRKLRKISRSALVYMTLAHMSISYWAISQMPGEEAFVSSVPKFIYTWVITATTIGFGDVTVETDTGYLFVAFFFVPFSLFIGAVALSHLLAFGQLKFRKKLLGLGTFKKMKNHIIIFGYLQGRTEQIIDLIFADKNRDKSKKVLLVTDQGIEDPFAEDDRVSFCHTPSMYEESELQRIALAEASRVIIVGANDDETFSLSVHCQSRLHEDAHISAYIEDHNKAKTLQGLNGRIEVSTPQVAEKLVKTMQDRGSMKAQQELFTNGKGHTQYLGYLEAGYDITVDDLDKALRQADVKLLAIAKNKESKGLDFTPDYDLVLGAGSEIHYIATERQDLCELIANDRTKAAA